jgi:ubiquitin-conjugating enzyme E2 variant
VEQRVGRSVYIDNIEGVTIMSHEPPPIVDFSLPPYTRKDIAYQAVGALLGLGLTTAGCVWLVRTWLAHPPSALAVFASLVAAIFVADFVSGLFHWAFDTWFDESIAPLRRSVVTVREHHIFPNRIFRVKFHEEIGTLAWNASVFTAVPILLILSGMAGSGAWTAYIVLMAVVFNLLLIFMLEFHKCGHRTRNPAWVRALQRSGLLLSRDHHLKHHRGNHDINYCLVTGWADLTLGRLGVFRLLERLIARATGAVPQRNDHEWLARAGRLVHSTR